VKVSQTFRNIFGVRDTRVKYPQQTRSQDFVMGEAGANIGVWRRSVMKFLEPTTLKNFYSFFILFIFCKSNAFLGNF